MSNPKRAMLSERREESLLRYANLIQYCRRHPLFFVERFLGIE